MVTWWAAASKLTLFCDRYYWLPNPFHWIIIVNTFGQSRNPGEVELTVNLLEAFVTILELLLS